VWKIARGFDAGDPYSRTIPPGADAAPWWNGEFRFGVPEDGQLKFFDDEEAHRLYQRSIERLESLGGVRTIVDFTIFREAAELLYSGPWVAERFAAVGEFLKGATEGVNEVVKNIVLNGASYSAADAFQSMYQLEALKQEAGREWARMDVMLLPTTGTIYTHEAVAADPVRLNSNLGFYTNFVNLMDLAAVAVPAGFRSNLPFGVSLIGPAFSDEALLAIAGRYLDEGREEYAAPGCVLLAVAGAHLSGQPLNHELTSRGARLVKTCRTAADYRLYSLPTKPAKPGLVRDPEFKGAGIEIEVWVMSQTEFGRFVAGIPAPLGIGTVQLEDGSTVKGFICEPAALTGAEEITRFGGWRQYLDRG
jgi:allophanate hydrolase